MNTDNSKTNEPLTFVLDLLQGLDLMSLNKHVPLHNLNLFITNGKKQGKSTKIINKKPKANLQE